MKTSVFVLAVLCALTAAAAVLFVREKLSGYTIKEVLLKSAASMGFIFIALFSACNAGSRSFAACVTGGLICGLLGDIWLDCKYVYPKDNDLFTFSGFYAFAAGHTLFMAALLLNYASGTKPLFIIIPLALGIVLGIANGFCGKLMKLDYGKYRSVSMFYGAFLFSMTLLSGSLALSRAWGCAALNLMFIGGVLFTVSDLVLSGTYFGQGHERPIDIILNYLFYYSAQIIIAVSVFFA